jgi:hypothetical protein
LVFLLLIAGCKYEEKLLKRQPSFSAKAGEKMRADVERLPMPAHPAPEKSGQ